MGGDEQKPPRVVAGRLGGRYDIPGLEADWVSVKPIGVALAEYCDKFVVGQLQITLGCIGEDFFIDTLRFLVGEAVAFVCDWVRHKCVKQFQSTDNKALALVACNDTAGIVRTLVVDFSRCHKPKGRFFRSLCFSREIICEFV